VCAKHAEQLRAGLEPFVAHARKRLWIVSFSNYQVPWFCERIQVCIHSR
jgi:hypothetical protein